MTPGGQRARLAKRLLPVWVWLGAWLVAGSVAAQSLELGEKFRVNERRAGTNDRLDVTALGEDAFIVDWLDSDYRPVGRRVDAVGPLSPVFSLAFWVTDLAGAKGALWATGIKYESGPGRVVLQHLDADGAPLSALVVSEEGDAYPSARIATAGDGTLMVVWFTYWDAPFPQLPLRVPEACYARGSYGRGFGPDGQPVSGPFEIPSSDGQPRVIPGAPGQFVVSGKETCYPGEGAATGERRSLDGSQVGAAFPLDEVEEITELSDGDFAGVWAIYYPPPREIRIRRYGPDGAPRGEVTSIRSCSDCLVGSPRIAGGAHDDFLVVWQERLIGTSDYTPRARWISASGSASEVAVVSTEEPYQGDLAVASDRAGRFLVVWGTDRDSGGYDIWGRVVYAPTLFSDGFESGDTTAWSQTVP